MTTSSNPKKSSTQDVLPRQTDQIPPADIEARHRFEETTIASRLQATGAHLLSNHKKEAKPFPDDHSSEEEVLLEHVPTRSYNLSYAFLMIPRFSSHRLIGDVSEYLHDWMYDICISFGWQLDGLVIHPEYLQWLLSVQPATSPSYCVQMIRRHTSSKIFEDFPHFKRENLSRDFWAPGYLPLVGTQLHPAELIKEYINQTRQQQGLPPRRRE